MNLLVIAFVATGLIVLSQFLALWWSDRVIEARRGEQDAAEIRQKEAVVPAFEWKRVRPAAVTAAAAAIGLTVLVLSSGEPDLATVDQADPSGVVVFDRSLGFLAADEAIAVGMYRQASTIDREIVMMPLQRLLEAAYERHDYDDVYELKNARLLLTASSHPEAADVNFSVLTLDETLSILGDDRRRATIEKVFRIQIDESNPQRTWRTDERYRVFWIKNLMGTRPITGEEARRKTSVFWGTDVSALEPAPRDACSFEPFRTTEEASNNIVIHCTLPLALLEENAGQAVVRFVLDGIEQAHPFSVYSFEPQRFYRGVDSLKVLIHSGLSSPTKDGADHHATMIPMSSSVGRREAVPVSRSFHREQNEWDYSFAIDSPKHLVAFSFGH